MRLLIAQEDGRDIKALKRFFETNNYLVDGVTSGRDALLYGETGEYDGVILDMTLSGMDGLEVLCRLRAKGISTPALFLTGRNEIRLRVECLNAGADDFLTKPAPLSELLARVRAMLRRKDSFTPDLLTWGGLSLNRSSFQLCWEGRSQLLSGREFQLMEMLMQRPGFVVTTGEFLSHVWGWDSEVDTSVVWVHISNIRKKLTALGSPVEIRFLRGAGYLLEKRQPMEKAQLS